jgi:hypothetical protein
MGSNFHMMTLVGIELEREQFMRSEMQTPRWCTCADSGSRAQFCPECGTKRPEPRMVRQYDHLCLPPKVAEIVAKRLAYIHQGNDGFEVDLLDVLEDMECPLDGDLALIQPPNTDLMFVGRLLDMRGDDDDEGTVSFDLEPLVEGLQEGIEALGIDKTAQLHLVGFWW